MRLRGECIFQLHHRREYIIFLPLRIRSIFAYLIMSRCVFRVVANNNLIAIQVGVLGSRAPRGRRLCRTNVCSIGMRMLGFICLWVREAKGAVMPAVLRGVTAVIASTLTVLSVIRPRCGPPRPEACLCGFFRLNLLVCLYCYHPTSSRSRSTRDRRSGYYFSWS